MENLYDKALEAIEELFGDKSATQEEAKANLEALIDEIREMLESLDV